MVVRPKSEAALGEIATAHEVGRLLTLDADGTGSLVDAAAGLDPDADVVAREADDLAAILYTSGTTGRSKGAMLSHGNLSSNALTLHDYWGFGRGDVLLHILPIYHVHGLFVALHTAILNGADDLFLPRFDAGRGGRRPAAGDRDDGRADLLYPPARPARLRPRRRAPTCACSSPARRRCCRDTFDAFGASAPATPSSNATA